MKKTLLCLGVITIMFSCSFINQFTDYEKIADKITAKTAAKIEKEKGLILIGTGGGMIDDIKRMMMGFQYFKIVDIDMARELLVYCVEEYLSAINSSEKVRPYLHNYPFTAKNVEIVIYFFKPDGSKGPSGKIKIASAKDGKIYYYIDDPEKHTLETFYKETYEEALKIVKSKNDKSGKID